MANEKYEPKNQKGWYKERNLQIVEMDKSGFKRIEIAEKFNISVDLVGRIIKSCTGYRPLTLH